MQIDLIIDGYNLMHAAGLARPHYGPGDLERARNRLLHRIRHGLSEVQRSRTTVVFDGRSSEITDRVDIQFHGMRVMYSPPGLEADDTIEDLISAHTAPKQLIVISSDHRLHKAALARKATPIDSEALLDQLDKNSSQPEQARGQHEIPEKPETVDEVEYWAKEFGEINVSEIAQSTRHMEEVNEEQPERAASERSSIPESSEVKQLENHSSAESPVENPTLLDVEFWQKRIAELDDESDVY